MVRLPQGRDAYVRQFHYGRSTRPLPQLEHQVGRWLHLIIAQHAAAKPLQQERKASTGSLGGSNQGRSMHLRSSHSGPSRVAQLKPCRIDPLTVFRSFLSTCAGVG